MLKKIMNDPASFVEESLEGILLAYPGFLKADRENPRVLYRAGAPRKGKVAIVTGGGYGHIPVFLGYVGEGLCDGVAVGNVFTSPSFDSVWSVTNHVDGGAGVLYLYGNYMGDGMNFNMAAEMADMEDIPTATVRVCDDVASAQRENRLERRGIAGIYFAYKIAGACADTMASLETVKEVAERAVANTASFGVAFSSCQLPLSDRPVFELGHNEIEIGMGIHGEPGVRRGRLVPSAELAEILIAALVEDLSLQSGDRVAVLVNGLGATSYEELYILYRDAHTALGKRKIVPERVLVGEYATSLEMAGASISLLKLDDELLTLLDMPCFSPFLNSYGSGERRR